MSDTAPSSETTSPSPIRWIVVVIAAVCLIALLAYARGKPGDAGRDPGPDEGAFAPALVIGA